MRLLDRRLKSTFSLRDFNSATRTPSFFSFVRSGSNAAHHAPAHILPEA
jgi:hypothetical protein